MSLVWLYAIVAVSLTLVAGTAGLVSLGHAALLSIGGYASALIAMDLHWPVGLAVARRPAPSRPCSARSSCCRPSVCAAIT